MISASRIQGWVAVSLATLVPVSGAVGAGSASPAGLVAEAGARPETGALAPNQQGMSAPIQLPAPAVVGQVAYVQAAIQTTIEGGPVSLSLATSASITNVGGDGSYTARSTIDSVDVTNAPASADVGAWGFTAVQGMSFDQSYAATGTPIDNAARSVDAQSLILDSVSMAYIGFPTTAVVVGESWNVDGTIGSDGLTFKVTYQCRLASVADGSYTVNVSYAENFSSPVESGVVDGTISGTGTLSGSLTNPLVVSGGLNQTIDGVRTVDGAATPMRTDTSVTLTAIGG